MTKSNPQDDEGSGHESATPAEPSGEPSEASASAEDAAAKEKVEAPSAHRRVRLRRFSELAGNRRGRAAAMAPHPGIGDGANTHSPQKDVGPSAGGQQMVQNPSGRRRTPSKSHQLGATTVVRAGIFQRPGNMAGLGAALPATFAEPPSGRFRASSRPRRGPPRGPLIPAAGRRGDHPPAVAGRHGPAAGAVLGRLPASARRGHAAARTASSGSRSRRRTSLSVGASRGGASAPSANQPSENNCYAYCLASRIDVGGLEAAWMESLRRRSRSIRANQVPRMGRSSASSRGSSAGPGDARSGVAGTRSGSNRSGTAAGAIAGGGGGGGAAAAAASSSGRARQAQEPSIPQDVFVVPLNADVKLLKVGHKDCFVFAFGCLVCWGCRPEEANRAKEALRPFLLDPLAPQNVDEDQIDITQRDGVLTVALSGRDQPTFQRVAITYGLAQSVRLGTLELRVDRWIAKTRSIPEQMAKAGYVSHLSSAQVTQLVGELFSLKHEVNLEIDILDTPEFFWNYGDYEPAYQSCRAHLDIDQRVSVMNQRFEVLQDLLEALESELNVRHGTRLEWVVIILCLLEGVVMAFRYYARVWVGHKPFYGISHKDTGAVATTLVETPPDIKVMPILWLLHWCFRVLVRWPLAALGGS